MSLLFDQNLPRRLPGLLAAEFPGREHVLLSGLPTADDRKMWDHAVARQLAIVSKDSDFAKMSSNLDQPPKVIWHRAGNGSTCVIAALLRARTSDIHAFWRFRPGRC